MYRGHTVGVVIPAYNEAGLVGEVIDALPAFVDRAYVVDDCSTDDTWSEIRERVGPRPVEAEADVAVADVRLTPGTVADGGPDVATEGAPAVVAIRHDENRGVGGAIKTGFRRAEADGMDVAAVVNGDGQTDPAILDRILDPVVSGESDFSKGNRLVSPAHYEGMSRWRLFGNVVLTLLTKVASGYWGVTDSQNGYVAISGDALADIDLDALYDGYGFLNDLLVTLNVHGARVAEVPMHAVYGDESSSIRYRTFVPRLSALLARDFVWRLRATYLLDRFHPLVLLYAVGVAGGVAGAAEAVHGALAADASSPRVAAVQTFLLSGLALALAMVFDREQNRGLLVDSDDEE